MLLQIVRVNVGFKRKLGLLLLKPLAFSLPPPNSSHCLVTQLLRKILPCFLHTKNYTWSLFFRKIEIFICVNVPGFSSSTLRCWFILLAQRRKFWKGLSLLFFTMWFVLSVTWISFSLLLIFSLPLWLDYDQEQEKLKIQLTTVSMLRLLGGLAGKYLHSCVSFYPFWLLGFINKRCPFSSCIFPTTKRTGIQCTDFLEQNTLSLTLLKAFTRRTKTKCWISWVLHFQGATLQKKKKKAQDQISEL